MINQNDTKSKILEQFIDGKAHQSSNILDILLESGVKISLVSVKRALSELNKEGALTQEGAGRSTSYVITTLGRLSCNINPIDYIKIEPDKRAGLNSYNFSLFEDFPKNLFTNNELLGLSTVTEKYRLRLKNTSHIIQEKELQRLVIELSWKSSKIEGNTYSLLDTEKLILENKSAKGHSKDEAQMILNHKDAFKNIRENKSDFNHISMDNIEEIHHILMKNLGIKNGLRNSLVGITGSKYKPLDNKYQIKEAMDNLISAINKSENAYTKAILALLGISYIQPFEDGNKRTSRLIANAILLSNGLAPLSYRSIDENGYRNAVLVFYEVNSIVSFKKIFIEQYLFAANNYSA